MNERGADEREPVDVFIIGAGPAGLQAACTAQDLGLSHRVIDRRGLAHSFATYPQALRFFSPPDEMAIGGIPFPMRGGDKPTREDILPYFRAVAHARGLNLSLWERVVAVRRISAMFAIETSSEPNQDVAMRYTARTILLASGVWDVPEHLHCEGDRLPHVYYRFHEPTEYFGQDVLVVGGGNSAVHAALALSEAHANVVFAMRRPPKEYQSHLRPFVVRDLEFAVNEGKVTLYTSCRVQRVEARTAWLQPAAYDPESPESVLPTGAPFSVPARFVFAMTGQRGDLSSFERIGLCLEADGRPVRDPDTYETNVSGIYVLGSLAGSKIDIILTGRKQSAAVVRHIARKLAQ